MPKLVCITGYRRTGKDSLYKLCNSDRVIYVPYIQNDNQEQIKDIEHYKVKWIIYQEHNHQFPFIAITDFKRAALADKLKIEVHKKLGLPDPENLEFYDKFKERMSIDGKSLRQHYIDYGQEKRDIDKDYWLKEIVKTEFPTCITDLRFQNELAYLKGEDPNLVTIRVFRRDVPIPPKIDDSSQDTEHNLDDYLTDFLLVDSIQSYDKLTDIMPCYYSYFPTYCIMEKVS
jgi:hypothetical protein